MPYELRHVTVTLIDTLIPTKPSFIHCQFLAGIHKRPIDILQVPFREEC